MGDPRVADGRRWGVLWVHHEAEELCVHYRVTISEMTARHVVVDLLASGRVLPMQMLRENDFRQRGARGDRTGQSDCPLTQRHDRGVTSPPTCRSARRPPWVPCQTPSGRQLVTRCIIARSRAMMDPS